MNLKPSPLTITKEAPYADDKLGREECAKVLTNVLNSAPDGLVLCINGTWGSGKSTFIEMWRTQLEGEFTTMLFNAWESDFVDDAMVALLGDLQTQAESLVTKGCPDPAAKKIDAFKRLGSKLVRGALPLAVRAATACLVEIDSDALKEILVDEAGKVAEAQIEAYTEAKASITGFKEALTELAKEIGVSGKPLVIFIDELDRCRPPFAIRVLEVVKHFFSVPGVVFVLALDREQLGHSIKSMYGADMDVGGYLRRFFDLEFNLPAGNGIRFIEGLCEKFDLTGMYDQLSKMSRDRASDYPPRVLAELFNALSCSPRDQEKCFTHLALVRLAATGAARWKPMALFPVIALRIKRPDLYLGIITGTKSIDKALEILSQEQKWCNYRITEGGVAFEWSLKALTTRMSDVDFLTQMQNALNIAHREEWREFMKDITRGRSPSFNLPPIGSIATFDAAINLVEHFST